MYLFDNFYSSFESSSFRTLKVQSFMLIELRDCDLLIVVTSSTFLKRKDMLKGKMAIPPLCFDRLLWGFAVSAVRTDVFPVLLSHQKNTLVVE